MIEEIKVVNKRTEKSITMGTDSRYDYIVPQGGFDFGEVEAVYFQNHKGTLKIDHYQDSLIM